MLGRLIATCAEFLGATGSTAHWADDILPGVIAGAGILVALRTLANRRAANLKRLQDIVEMNHHIRNALQIIRSSHFSQNEDERVHVVAEASSRIESALREFDLEQGEPHMKANVPSTIAGISRRTYPYAEIATQRSMPTHSRSSGAL